MSVFIIENLTKVFTNEITKNVILDDISFEFPDNGLFSIVGKSGCGKSTLLNILMGIEHPTSGKVCFNGKDISKMNDREFSEYHLDGVSLVFQHYNLFDDLTSFENVILPLQIKGLDKNTITNKANKLFRDFNLEKLKEQKAEKLSGGEKQRIAILRSLICNPIAILCDEPTGALDYQNSREIMGILREISKKTLVIMVSHNKELVEEFSDYIITLKNGKIHLGENVKIKNDFKSKKNYKYTYSSKWIKKFLSINLFKNRNKNLFSLFACLISFCSMFLAVGFSIGSKESQTEASNKNLSIGFASVSEVQSIKIEGASLSFIKTTRPEIELIDEYFSDFDSIRIEENISYFFSNNPTCFFENSKIENFEMVPVYDLTLNSFGNDMLIAGSGSSSEFDEVIVNEQFDDMLGGNTLNKMIIVSNECTVNYQTNVENNPFIKDTFTSNKKFKICGIIREFSFLNAPKIYYSYLGAKKLIKNAVMENVTNYLGHRYTFFDYLCDVKNDDPVSSYSSYIFVTNPNEIDRFFEKIPKMNDSELEVTSRALETRETYGTFINSFSNALIIFVVIAFLGVNFILGIISLSTFLENKKNTAVLTCLGARNKSVYNMHLIMNFLIIFFGYIFSIVLAVFLQPRLNKFLYEKFVLKDLINIPFKSFMKIPFGLPIFVMLLAMLCSFIFTLIPMMIYRKNSLTEELRDE